jgi:hypothetical protein
MTEKYVLTKNIMFGCIGLYVKFFFNFLHQDSDREDEGDDNDDIPDDDSDHGKEEPSAAAQPRQRKAVRRDD